MNRSRLAGVIAAAVFTVVARASAFDRATAAVTKAKFREAATLFADAAANDPDPVRRARAEIRLANIEWRAFRRHADARARLQRVAAGTHENGRARIELSRVAHDLKDFATARTEAQEALRIAATARDRQRATLAFASAVIDAGGEMRDVIVMLRKLIDEQGPHLQATKLLLKAALLAGDGSAAMQAVDGYYHVTAFSPPPNAIRSAHAELNAVLPSWKGTPNEREAIARALAGVRFFEEAALVARDGAPADVVAYAAAVRKIEEIANEHYRQVALDSANPAALRKAVDAELRTFWSGVSKTKFNSDAVIAEMGRRFGAHLIFGETGGFKDMHFGHVAGDRELRIEQYGRTATLRFVELDSMVSNGIASWLSDGEGGDGGWATETEIYQVRSMYADAPLRAYTRMFDDALRAEEDHELEEESARDRQRAKTKPIGEFPGLVKRLQRQYLQTVLSEISATGDALRDAFIARLERDTFNSSIVMHEGRHSIDKLSKEKFKVWEMEYRAKLSEIALADAPRPALRSVLNFAVGGESPHGKANEQVAKGLVAWMEQHRDSIAGLETNLPLLPQIDKLTDEQIRRAAQSLDPLAPAHNASPRTTKPAQ